jgi:excisionase family DNA binding protein
MATTAKKKITMQEAAEIYGVHVKTIRRYIASGLLSAERIGPRLIRLDAEEVHQQLAGPVRGC